jgi:hypothetical protein
MKVLEKDWETAAKGGKRNFVRELVIFSAMWLHIIVCFVIGLAEKDQRRLFLGH